MPKLNQIVAIEDGSKKSGYADLTKTHHVLQKPDLFNGFISTYKPYSEDPSLNQPEQRKAVQQNAPEIVRQAWQGLIELWNIVATKDNGNCRAKADVVVEGKVLATQVPVTHLLFLEKQLTDLRTFISKLPVLDPSKEWVYDANAGMYKTTHPEQRIRTRKVPKSIVKIEPGPHSPGQAEIVTLDEAEGMWTQVDMSTAYPADKIREMLERVNKLVSAVKFAREEANSIEVEKAKGADVMLSYVFEG